MIRTLWIVTFLLLFVLKTISHDSEYHKSLEASLEPGALGEEQTKKFFLYPLEKARWWAWPDQDCPIVSDPSGARKELSGMGRLVDQDKGLFATWEFSLFSNFYNRLKRSSRRTYNMNEASLFIIPYDLALDGTTDKRCNTRNRCTEGSHADLTGMLLSTRVFLKHNGLDHVILWSYYQGHTIPKVCSAFLKRTCSDCLITTTWKREAGQHLPGTDHLSYESVPSPAYYHWYEGMSNAPWATGVPRKHAVTFVSRGVLTDALDQKLLEYSVLSTLPVNVITLDKLLSEDERAKVFAVYSESVFCVAPIGPHNNLDHSHELFLNAVLAGCIPVINDTSFVAWQYPWHLTKTIVEAMSVVYNVCPCSDDSFVKDIIAMCPPSAVTVKQRIIAKVAPLLQYSMPPLDRLEDIYDETTWNPPFLDAVDMALDGMIERAELLKAGHSDVEVSKSTAIRSFEDSLAPDLAELKQVMDKVEMKRHICGTRMCSHP